MAINKIIDGSTVVAKKTNVGDTKLPSDATKAAAPKSKPSKFCANLRILALDFLILFKIFFPAFKSFVICVLAIVIILQNTFLILYILTETENFQQPLRIAFSGFYRHTTAALTAIACMACNVVCYQFEVIENNLPIVYSYFKEVADFFLAANDEERVEVSKKLESRLSEAEIKILKHELF